MKPIVFYDFKPDKDDPNNKIVIKKSDLDELLNKTYEAGYQGQKAKEKQGLKKQSKTVCIQFSSSGKQWKVT